MVSVDEALQIIDQATAALVANRADHARIVQALNVIRDALTTEG